jgi:hypothetical protein
MSGMCSGGVRLRERGTKPPGEDYEPPTVPDLSGVSPAPPARLTTEPPVSTGRTLYLAAEFLALFAAGPVLHYAGVVRPPLFLVLWGLGIGALVWLWRDRGFDRASLWRLEGFAGHMRPIVVRWLAATAAVTAFTALYKPELLLRFPLERTGLWVMVVCLYPVFSVIPQGLFWRSFMQHRYRGLFPTPASMIPASAAAFSFGHIIFQNWLAVVLTAVGGVLFALTYSRTRSGLIASIEHAMYGTMVFTVGLGAYLVAKFIPG